MVEPGKSLTPEDSAVTFALLDAFKVAFPEVENVPKIWDAVNAFYRKLEETHAVVPREPTIGMFRELVASWGEPERAAVWTLGSFREDYQAMLNATK